MEKISIKGKEYIMVNERLKYFRENFKDYALVSEIVSLENNVCLFIAKVINPDGIVVATGHAYEKEGSSFINKTSYIENAETSAWGRALANFGIGIDTSVASYEEVANAQKSNSSQKSKSKLDRNHKLTFGKNKGKPIKDVDTGYLEWLSQKAHKKVVKDIAGKELRIRSLKDLWDMHPEDRKRKVSKNEPETIEELENCIKLANKLKDKKTNRPTGEQVKKAKELLTHEVLPDKKKLKIEKKLSKLDTKEKYAEALAWLEDEVYTREKVQAEEG